MSILFWICIWILIYIYFGYFAVLILLKKAASKSLRIREGGVLNLTIIIPAYNEEKRISRRIRNLLSQDYPKDKIEIIVASDGSNDKTVEIAKQFEGIKILDFKQNRGRAAVHNDAVRVATGEIIIFTDANTMFEKDFLWKIVNYFSEPIVGCVVGNLFYKTKETSISKSEGFYWRFEKRLRELESKLGLLATATGACMAVRKSLWKDLTPVDDCDFTAPLDVILQGYKVVYAPDAIAYDVPPSSIKGELKSRIRQTSKNLVGTLKRWSWKGWIKHPFVSWGLLSHKILRWLTPFFMIGVFISNIFLLDKGFFYQLTFIGQVAFYIVALIGLFGELMKRRIPLASTIFSFCVANIGMAIGIIIGLIGKAPATYKTEK